MRSWSQGEAGDAGAAAVIAGAGAGAETVAAGAEAASPLSHDMGRPAFNASMSASLSSGRPSRFRQACSIARIELLSGFLGQGGRCPSTLFTTLFGESSAICTCPLVSDPKLRTDSKLGDHPACDRKSIVDVVNFSHRLHHLFQLTWLSSVFDIQADEASVIQSSQLLFSVPKAPLFVG